MRILALAALPCVLVAQETVTTTRDQRALAVTIYNDNLALVKDLREVKLAKGELDLAFQEVSAQIRPETALLRNLTESKEFWINEQNFDFDLLTPQKLLEKYVGQKVTVLSQLANPDGAGSREVREDAEVLASNGGVVLKFSNRIETSVPGRLIYPKVPDSLRARPTLVLNLHSPAARDQKLELSYLTGGLSWRADYVANLAPDEKSLDLSGWVTLTNLSGAAYPNATLQLVAGDVHRAQTARADMSLAFAAAPGVVAKKAVMKEEALLDYHLYTLDRPTTLKENQTKQVALLTAQNIPARKDYLLRGDSYYYQGRYESLGEAKKVAVVMSFDNRTEAHLGLPLPKGVIRVYQRDTAGRPQFVGEDNIDHTPKNERVRLKLGDAFDITARRKQTDYQSLGPQGHFRNVYEASFQIELKNAKKEAVTVNVQEPIPGDWQIVQKSHDFTKESSGMVQFQVTVPAEGSTILNYRTQVRW